MIDDQAPWVQHPYGRAKAPHQHPQPEQVLVNYDIVASLRASAEWIKDVEHESWFDTADLQNDAADEIEQLRRLCSHMATLLDDCRPAEATREDVD